MKSVIIALVSLVSLVSATATAMVTPANGCTDNKCAVEALFHPNDKGETIFADRPQGAQYLAVNEGVIVSGPDYGDSTLSSRPTYSA